MDQYYASSTLNFRDVQGKKSTQLIRQLKSWDTKDN